MRYLLIFTFLFTTHLQAQEEAPAAQLNINNLAMWVRANGLTGFGNFPNITESITFPAGKVPVVYQDGFVWGGVVRDGQEPEIRVGGNTFTGGTNAGIIQADGTPGDVTRIWRIRKDFATADLRRDAALFFQRAEAEITPSEIDEIKNQYKTDWQDWPADLGAPFYDADRDGLYTPQFDGEGSPLLYPESDEPGYANADQVIWLVYNDADSAKALTFAGSPSIGLETQVTIWAYKSPALENVIYKRWKMIYKGTSQSPPDAEIDSMFVIIWSDVDLGSFGDDFLGFDEERMQAYVYNSYNTDNLFTEIGSQPPALGYDLIAGPIVKTENPQDIAYVDFQSISYWKNQPFYSVWLKGTGSSDSDPNRGDNYDGTLQWYNVMLGYRPRPESPREPWVNPWTSEIILFQKTGDPIANSGWLDNNPGDRRIFSSSGPFAMARSDTQEVVIAIVAGLGVDRLDSIIKLRQNDDIAQAAFDQNAFQIIPSATVQTQIHNESATIKLQARADSLGTQSITAQLVDAQDQIYFEEASTQPHFLDLELQDIPPIEEGLFLNLKMKNEDGQEFIWPKMQSHITTSGPLSISAVELFDDNINADGIANPGEFIHFGVVLDNRSAFRKTIVNCRIKTGQYDYAYDAENFSFKNIVPHSQASMTYQKKYRSTYFSYQIPAEIQPGQFIAFPVTITDQKNNIWYDTLKIAIEAPQQPLTEIFADHIEGNADGNWGVRLMDLGAIKNHEYQIYFNNRITLYDLTAGTTLFGNYDPPEENSLNMPIIDGFRLTLGTIIPNRNTRGWSYSNEAQRWFSTRGWEDFFLDSEFYPGTGHQFSGGTTIQPADFKDIEIRFVQKTGFTDLNGNNQYDIGEPYEMPEKGIQKAWFYSAPSNGEEIYEGFHNLPFTVWDISSDPPHQLAVVLNDWDKNLQWDLRKVYDVEDPNYVDVNSGRIWGNYLFILDLDYDPIGLAFDASTSDKFFGIHGQTPRPILWTLYFTEREGYEQLSSAGTLQLYKNTPPTTEDVYTFNPYQLFVGVQEDQLPLEFQLLQNYPNPFNPETTIAFSLAKQEHVKLKIYNILGQEIATLIDKKIVVGNHIQVWKGLDMQQKQVASGVYFYKLTAGKFEAVKKMAVVR